MRLGQLARKVAVRPAEIVSFLATHEIAVEDGSNTRLDDDHVALVLRQFAPNLIAEPIAPAEDRAEEFVPVTANPVDLREAVPLAPESDIPDEKPADEKTEVIKAPKVELSGLKVLGKIELPEVKKKEVTVPDEASSEIKGAEKPVAEIRKKTPYKKDTTDHRATRKNPIALQRDRETQEAERKRQAREEQEKEQRTKNYYKRVKASAPTKRIKMVEEPITEMSADELKEAPRSLLGKFFRWLKT